jgi:hypothetical protein
MEEGAALGTAAEMAEMANQARARLPAGPRHCCSAAEEGMAELTPRSLARTLPAIGGTLEEVEAGLVEYG